MKLAPLFFTSLPLVHAASLPSPSPPPPRVVQYDGPYYELPESEKEKLATYHLTNKSYTRPADMPLIYVEEGTILEMGAANSSLSKRGGWRRITAHSRYNCVDRIVSVDNFGCGTGCVVMNRWAWSGRVQQEYHGNPYPTMDVFNSGDCTGSYQHMGVVNTDSCTNDACCGFLSFIGWWDCRH
ncbi:hypothetical protein B0T14DRAFT_565397 [Immersiella caudata]|uniref:SCP domain-containing protein n=1 Tax=Immersiella caudata TaxID=314043 RepID=A0AA39WYT0_9PEZI|nr:hypothetical protein B0T14DRAFT_565397 [Immersiella caudata]